MIFFFKFPHFCLGFRNEVAQNTHTQSELNDFSFCHIVGSSSCCALVLGGFFASFWPDLFGMRNEQRLFPELLFREEFNTANKVSRDIKRKNPLGWYYYRVYIIAISTENNHIKVERKGRDLQCNLAIHSHDKGRSEQRENFYCWYGRSSDEY